MMNLKMAALGTLLLIILVASACNVGYDPLEPTDAASDKDAPDTAGVDTGTADTGVPDTGVPDTGVPDTGVPDAGVPDAGVPDAGVPDTQDQDISDEDTQDQDVEDQDTDENTPDADPPVEPPPSIGDVVGMSAGGGTATSTNYHLVVGIGQMPTGQLQSANYRVNVVVAPPPRN